MSDTAPTAEDLAALNALNTIVGDDEVSVSNIALTAVHVPGSPLERTEDRASTEAMIASNAGCVGVPNVPIETVHGIDTRSAEANLASRSNIVRSAASA